MVKILHLPDLHVGSLWAPMHRELMIPDVLGDGYMAIDPTPLQEHLYMNYLKIVKSRKWDLVLVNGDTIDGPNTGSQGRHCWSADISVQIDIAKQMLSKIDTKKMLFTCGTLYHSVGDRPAEQELASHFARNGLASWYGYDHLLKIEGWKVHVAHCIDHRGSKYDALSKEMGCRGADIVLRGHRHESAMITDGKRYATISPCWQWRNEYGVTNGMYNGTDIGAQEIDITSDEVNIKTHLVDMSKFKQPVELEF